MGVSSNQYLILGVRLPYPKGDDAAYGRFEPFIDSGHDEEVNRHLGLTVIFDGMDGKYVLIGHVLARSDNHEPLEGPIEVKMPEPDFLNLVAALLKTHFQIEDPNLSLWFVTHYH